MAYFAEGARGLPIKPLRERLLNVQGNIDPAFESFDAPLTAAVKEFQKQKGMTQTGVVDEALYVEIIGGDSTWPGLLDRAIMVVGAVENHGYAHRITADGGDADPAGITAGVVGFTAANGSLFGVLDRIPEAIRIKAREKHSIQDTELEKLNELIKDRDQENRITQRRNAAMTLFLAGGSVKPKWEGFFKTVLATPEGLVAQRDEAENRYLNRARVLAGAYGIKDEPGLAFLFNYAVNKWSAGFQYAPVETVPARERRLTIAFKASEAVKRNTVDPFERRHLGLAAGRGFPIQKFLDVRAFGFDDDAPPPLARVLPLAMASAPQMSALPQFAAAALTHKLVVENVLDTDAVRNRITAANGFALPDFSRLWSVGLRANGTRAARARRIELMAELNERSVSCLIIGATNAGLNSVWGKKSVTHLSVIGKALIWNRQGDLWFPLCPRMPAALIVLYTPNGIARDRCIAKALRQGVGNINDHPPLIVGWTGRPTFPPEGSFTLADDFFGQIAGSTLEDLIRTTPEKIIQAWGKACHDAFANSAPHLGLWRAEIGKKKKARLDACAALAPDGKIWQAMANPTAPTFMEQSA